MTIKRFFYLFFSNLVSVQSQLKRKDKEVENLFAAVQNTIDAKDTTVERCRVLSETNLPILKIKLDETLTLCENVLQREPDKRLVSETGAYAEQFRMYLIRIHLFHDGTD